MFRKFTLVITALVLMVGSIQADGARTPIYESTTINASGHYYLTRDITNSSGYAITIDASGVVLDLNGFTIQNLASSYTIYILEGSVNVTIRNGRINGGSYGIRYSSTIVRTRVTIEDVLIENGSSGGIYLNGVEYVSLHDCEVLNVGGYGVYAHGFSDAFVGSFIGNTIQGVNGSALHMVGLRNSIVRNNHISDYAMTVANRSAIYVWHDGGWSTPAGNNIIEGNTMQNPNGLASYGISLFPGVNGNSIRNNIIESNGNDGMLIQASYNSITGNVVMNSGFDGIDCSGGGFNIIQDNQIQNSGAYGLNCVGATNHYRNNHIINGSLGAANGGTDDGGNII